MIPVILESPYAATAAHTIEDHRQYHAECMIDSLSRGEAPISSHGTWAFSNILLDACKHERQLGINAGLAWMKLASHVVVYTDLGISVGMKIAIAHAEKIGRKVVFRTLRPSADKRAEKDKSGD